MRSKSRRATSAAKALSRGTVYGTLSVSREGVVPVVRINESVLAAVLTTMKSLTGEVDAAAPRLDGILGLKGVMEVIEEDESEEARRAAEAAVIDGFNRTLSELAAMRRREGEALAQVLTAALCGRLPRSPRARTQCRGASPRRSRRGIADQVATLLEASNRFDPDRLHQEAILLATKADIREELDRLASHVAQVEQLLGGRRRHRAAARLPGAGVQPRDQYHLFQVDRCRIDQYRAGVEGRRRAVSRTGAESGIGGADRPTPLLQLG